MHLSHWPKRVHTHTHAHPVDEQAQARTQGGLLGVTRNSLLKLMIFIKDVFMIFIKDVFTEENGKPWAKCSLNCSPNGLLVNHSNKIGPLRHPQDTSQHWNLPLCTMHYGQWAHLRRHFSVLEAFFRIVCDCSARVGWKIGECVLMSHTTLYNKIHLKI